MTNEEIAIRLIENGCKIGETQLDTYFKLIDELKNHSLKIDDENRFADKLREMTNNYVKAGDELFECKKIIKKALEMLGEYAHYSTPTEEQNSKNEDIVNNAIEILNERYK